MTRPTIQVRGNSQDVMVLLQVLYGIEEEGIPVELINSKATNPLYESYQGALESPLLVGVGVMNDQVVVHYRNLPENSPVFQVERASTKDIETLRALGSNAARLVKGIPFK
jgi:hypothetical protein